MVNKSMGIYLHSFRSVKPLHHRRQSELVNWTLRSHERAESFRAVVPEPEKFKRMLSRFCLREEQIQERYFECDDVTTEWEKNKIYHLNPETPHGANIFQKNLFFQERGISVFQEIYEQDKVPDHLLHVTCTGYVAPSPPQIYFSRKAAQPSITHAYHMGCYASLPTIRLGMSLAANETVDIVHTEMCSLHLDPMEHTPEQMVVQTLFADGHIKYRLDKEVRGFEVLLVKEKILPESEEDMTWVPAPVGMKMTLSRNVPSKIGTALLPFLQELSQSAGMSWDMLKKEALFAVHPGGPKIIDTVQKLLELSEAQVSHSKNILLTRGNMSSATLPHVWQSMNDDKLPAGKFIVSLAFGPGLTIFGSLFRVAP